MHAGLFFSTVQSLLTYLFVIKHKVHILNVLRKKWTTISIMRAYGDGCDVFLANSERM